MSRKDKNVKTTNQCCNCGKDRVLNHRFLCKECASGNVIAKPKAFPLKDEKAKHCSKCNYVFPNGEYICNEYGEICCSCCKEMLRHICTKEIKFGRKVISLKVSMKTKQSSLASLEKYPTDDEIMDMFA